jgi:hypothetical protein
MRLVGWIVNPVSGFDSVHQAIGWDGNRFVVDGNPILPADFPGVISHGGAQVLWTGLNLTLNPDPTAYNSFELNALTDGQDQQALNDKWMEYCSAAQTSEGTDTPIDSSTTV